MKKGRHFLWPKIVFLGSKNQKRRWIVLNISFWKRELLHLTFQKVLCYLISSFEKKIKLFFIFKIYFAKEVIFCISFRRKIKITFKKPGFKSSTLSLCFILNFILFFLCKKWFYKDDMTIFKKNQKEKEIEVNKINN